MRKLVLTLAFLLSLVMMQQVYSQGSNKQTKEDKRAERKLRDSQVSYQSKEQFIKDFGNNVRVIQWRRSTGFDEVIFMENGDRKVAYYDQNFQLVGVTMEKQFTDLPREAQEEIKEKYSDYTVVGVIFFRDEKYNEQDMFLYGIQFDDDDHYFVELSKGVEKLILDVGIDGRVSYFNTIR